MKTKAYVDTNIIIYAIFHHQEFGKYCERILYDIEEGKIEGYGSYLVAMELLGSLSKINPVLAWKATKNYLAMKFKILDINELVLNIAGLVNTIVNVKYDAIHLALMLINDIDTVITNDLDDWLKISKNFNKITKKLREENYDIKMRRINIISPIDYTRDYHNMSSL